MAEIVIDGLEIVHIQHHQGQGLHLLTGTPYLLLQEAVQGAPVVHAGQLVSVCYMPQLPVVILQLLGHRLHKMQHVAEDAVALVLELHLLMQVAHIVGQVDSAPLPHAYNAQVHIVEMDAPLLVPDVLTQGINPRGRRTAPAHLQLLIDILVQQHTPGPAADRKNPLRLEAHHVVLDAVGSLNNHCRVAITELYHLANLKIRPVVGGAVRPQGPGHAVEDSAVPVDADRKNHRLIKK